MKYIGGWNLPTPSGQILAVGLAIAFIVALVGCIMILVHFFKLIKTFTQTNNKARTVMMKRAGVLGVLVLIFILAAR